MAEDIRVWPIRRQLIVDIEDSTPIDFDRMDLELIAEQIEGLLRRNYDVKVTLITVRDVRDE